MIVLLLANHRFSLIPYFTYGSTSCWNWYAFSMKQIDVALKDGDHYHTTYTYYILHIHWSLVTSRIYSLWRGELLKLTMDVTTSNTSIGSHIANRYESFESYTFCSFHCTWSRPSTDFLFVSRIHSQLGKVLTSNPNFTSLFSLFTICRRCFVYISQPDHSWPSHCSVTV